MRSICCGVTAGAELEHQFVRRKPRFANWRHARTGRQRNDRQVNEPRAGRRAIAALPPVGEAARVSSHRHPVSRRPRQPASYPRSCCRRCRWGRPRAGPNGIWKVKPPPLGVRACGLLAKAGIDRTSRSRRQWLAPIFARSSASLRPASARSLMLSVGTLTVCVNAAEVLATLLGSPPYFAVIEWLPTASEEVVKVAVPAASVPVPICVPPSKKVTVPVGENPVTLAVNVHRLPKARRVFRRGQCGRGRHHAHK